jgi:Mg-chelatase subunit ChlD
MRPIDIVMVLDASTTMLDRTEDGRRKLDAALDALRQFSGLLDPERERLALVVFNDEATLVAELSADRADLLAVLPGIMVKAGSRIDLGLIRAGEALDAAEPRSDLRKVVILLTDGRLAGADPSTFPAAAFALKGQGVTIYALGLDPIPEHRDLMRQVASGPSRYVDVGDGSRLGDVYLDIAGTLGCP